MIILTESYLNEFATQPQQQPQLPGVATRVKNNILHPIKSYKVKLAANSANNKQLGWARNATDMGSEARKVRLQNYANAYAKHFG